MSSPVVVQGTAVDFGSSTQPISHGAGGPNHQPAASGCKDPAFAVLFYINVIAILAVAAIYGPDAFADDATYSYEGYIYCAFIMSVLSACFALVSLSVLMCIPETMIKVSLIFVVVMSGIWAVMAFLAGSVLAGIFGLVFFAIGLCYARAVWGRIPFAAANMTTAITAIKANLGVTVIALFFTALAVGWSILWAIAFSGTLDTTYDCNDQGQACDANYGFLFLLFVSYFFTHQVIQNSVHVTVAGVVGTWWLHPAESGCCGKAVFNSFFRTVTTSFGSICFGSLVVAVIRALETLARTARQNDDAGIIACIAECILSCIANIVEYFNKWAYVYVGVYGFGYIEAGKNVFALFRDRGWEAIIADDLVGNTLMLVSLIVGGILGAISLIFVEVTDWFDDAGGNDQAIAFAIGFVVGLAICSIFLSTVASGVNTVIVMFADSPAEFQENHPELSNKMLSTWRSAFPGAI